MSDAVPRRRLLPGIALVVVWVVWGSTYLAMSVVVLLLSVGSSLVMVAERTVPSGIAYLVVFGSLIVLSVALTTRRRPRPRA